MTGTLLPADVAQTPGEAFAAAAAAAGPGDLVVPFSTHLPAAFPLFASRPRYPVRHLLKTAATPDGPATFVHEPPVGALAAAGTSYAATPEAAFAPVLQRTPLTDLVARVPAPAGILDHPELLPQYVDFRVLVRLSVVENQSLLTGTADGAIKGLLNLPGTRDIASPHGLAAAVTETAAEVEETGGSCDGVVAHPFTYWEMVRTGLLERLRGAGVTVSRTRMIPRDTLLLGDFRAAFTLLLPDVAHIALRRGAGADGGDVFEASSRIGLAVHLPQHLIALTWQSGE
ncbi:family 3 encapsulin nanocompartment shell protein [Actinokineospora pegani]|uniref:family 3 encapsulin nanocompartment shell protein n=1 Tax=Actinokineospora pegani TaxID=2654637 RepID=UPI0018D286AF|nr:family 3 encapsulin nanocompartment shell protein [Actinokineospora pegani]